MLPIIDLFVSIQGEGKYMGVPSIFIRTSGCNLRCAFKNSICDTPYSSWNNEKSKYTIDDVINIIKHNPKIDHIVITGGEPLLHGKELENMLTQIWEDRFVVTIETNGTMPILNPLTDRFKIALYSVSPKLKSSEPDPNKDYGGHCVCSELCQKHKEQRINIKNLYRLATTANDIQFKFVYSGPECVKEIEDLFLKISAFAEAQGDYDRKFYQGLQMKKNIMLMPEGITEESLQSLRREVADICIKKGWIYTDRLHITIFGDKRGF